VSKEGFFDRITGLKRILGLYTMKPVKDMK
jgi:hypothetical protein